MSNLRIWLPLLVTSAVVLTFATMPCAAPALTLIPTTGPPSTSVRVNGMGFGVTEGVDIYFDNFAGNWAATDGSGNFSQNLVVNRFIGTPGTHWVTAIGRKSGVAEQKPFLVNTNWLQFRYDVPHRGFNTFEHVLDFNNAPSLAEAWVAHTGGAITMSSPALVNGVVYIGSSDQYLYAFNASTGVLIWKRPTNTKIKGEIGSPAVANGIVYVGLDKLYAFNAASGVPLPSPWPVSIGGAAKSSPFVANGVVYIGSINFALYAFNATSGAPLSGWPKMTGGAIYSTPTIANGVVYVGSSDSKLYAFNAISGVPLPSPWPVSTAGAITSSPAAANGVVYVGSQDNLYAFHAISGILLSGWPVVTGGLVGSSPAVAGGAIYFASNDGNLYAVSAITGTAVPGWPVVTSGVVASALSSPAVANGVVYVGAPDGNIYAFGAEAFPNFLWGASTGNEIESSPAVADEAVYVGSADGTLHAYNLRASTTTFVRRAAAAQAAEPTTLFDYSQRNP